jgi:hypothetical protein
MRRSGIKRFRRAFGCAALAALALEAEVGLPAPDAPPTGPIARSFQVTGSLTYLSRVNYPCP